MKIVSDVDSDTTVVEPERSFHVSLPPTDVSVAIARSMIRRIAVFASEDAESSFLVALTEVVGNAVDEHRNTGIADPVSLVVQYGNIDVVRVVDSGRGIDLIDRSTSRSTTSDQSGRGLTLARAFVPGMTFDTTGNGTTVSLPLTGLGIVR